MSRELTPIPITVSEFMSKGGSALVSFQRDFFEYRRNHYEKVSEQEIEYKLINFLNDSGYEREAKCNYIKDMVAVLHAFTSLDKKIAECNQWTIEQEIGGIFLVVKNGIVLISPHYHDSQVRILPHSSAFFSLGYRDYNYDPSSDSTLFKQTIENILVDFDTRRYVQELFGYCLTYRVDIAKLTLFYGSGANGKSVLLTILKLLIGEHNCSSLPIEAFYGGNRFISSEIEGKTANVYEEMPDNTKLKTSEIKNIVTGGDITIERKFKPFKRIKPTVKLVYATNTLPDIPDKSDGIFRRLVIIPFTQQFLTPEEQDSRLIDRGFWLNSGEMEGILAWAIDGLCSLVNRGHFIEPESSLQIKARYRLEQNHERQFLLDHYEYTGDDADEISSYEIYARYEKHCSVFGLKRSSSIKLGQEVRRIFPQIIQTQNPRSISNLKVKSRFWQGIKPIVEQTEQREVQLT